MYLDHYCLPNICNTSLQNIIISQLSQEKKSGSIHLNLFTFLKTKFLCSTLITTNRLIRKFQIKWARRFRSGLQDLEELQQ